MSIKQIVCKHPVASGRSHDFFTVDHYQKHAYRSYEKIAFMPDTNISEHFLRFALFTLVPDKSKIK